MNNHPIDAAEGGLHHDLPVTGGSLRAQPHPGPEEHERPWRHLLMMAMCLPMLVIVGALVITGVAGAGAISYALLCTAMMAATMMLMRGDRH
jgi:hypothetical protein